MMTLLGFLGSIGPWEVVALLALGLLIFGKRLPEVGRSLGRGVVEFKKGLSGIESDIDQAGRALPPGNGGREHDRADSGQEAGKGGAGDAGMGHGGGGEKPGR